MDKYTFGEHFTELKKRFIKVLIVFVVLSGISYFFSEDLFRLLLFPLRELLGDSHKIIYTGLTEAFITYLKLACYSGLYLSLPYLLLQIYKFISPGLYSYEKKLIGFTLFFAPFLFYSGAFFVFYYVMPKAWQFFLSFETIDRFAPITLEARLSEYLSLVLQLVTAFGFAFQLPIIMVICNVLGFVSANSLKNKRRLAIVIIFTLAAICTPPDILSQIALALPLMILYEVSILLCKFLEQRRKDNAGYQMD